MSSERWQQVEHIFNSALGWEPSERATRLVEACHGDEVLRKEVESLLAADQRPLTWLDGKVWESMEPDSLPPGSQFGCYRIEALLGEGGMGGVYRATDIMLGREVAFKVLAQAVAGNPDYLRRFEEEARLASSLNHPNIVTIYAVGEDRGVAYIAMELVRGRTLAELLREGPIAAPRVLDLAVQLADALAAAHESGIIHRDLKPANIMITAEDGVKVLDFGLAKRHRAQVTEERLPFVHLAPGSKTRTSLTGAGVILGTVGYMSPEQAAGGEADYTSDQFSFGAILYEMLSGQRAFKRETDADTLAAIIREQPAAMGSHNVTMTAPLERIVERCLAKKPSDRYAGTGELVAALRDVRSGAEPSAALAGSRRLTRRGALWGFGGAVAGALALTALKFSHGESGVRALAVLPFENTAKDADTEVLCDGLTVSLMRQIAGVEALTVRPRSAVFAFKGKAVDPRAAGRQLRVDAVVTGSIVRRAGKLSVRADLVDVRTGASLWGAHYDRDDTGLMGIQDEIANGIVNEGIRLKLSGDDRRRLARHSTNDSEANELYMRALSHQDKETEDDYLTARQLLKQAIDRDKNFALAYGMLATNYSIMAIDGYAPPSESWPHVLDYAQQALHLDPSLLAPHLEIGSEAFFNQWNWALAEKEYQIGASASGGPISEVLGGYEMERWAVGQPADALRLIRKYRELDLVSPSWMLKEADLLLWMGQNEKAVDIYDAVISDAREDDRAYFGKAEARAAQQRFDEAIALLAKGYQAAGQDDERFAKLLATARGEKGYRQMQRMGAQLELEGLNQRTATGRYVSPLDFARACSRLGYGEEAFKYLDRAFADVAPGLVFLKVDRAWTAIREDPRFGSAVKRVGLP